MSTNNEQNGRQPPLPSRPPLPSDPRAGNVSERPLCRKYVWGTCTKGINCKFRHDLELEEMKKILKFCHDFQNKQGCGRVDCSYLHASKEEENSFRNNNQIPRVLLERYAALAEASNSMQNFEGVPQMMMFVTAPPPPPPPPAQMLPAAVAPPPPPPPQPGPTFPTIQQPPPPPPPPPTMPVTAIAQSPAVFTGSPQQPPVMFPMNQPPPQLPPLFDASRPPPPIPGQTKSASKRRMECEAGPSKVRKAEGPKAEACDNCVQREIRISVYKQQLEKITGELSYQKLVYKNKLNSYENGREILRSLVSSDLFRILEEYVEGGPPQVQDILAQISTNPIMTLLEYLFTGARNVDSTLTTPSLRLDDTLSSFSSLSRITNPISHPSSDLLHSLIEVFRKTNSERETRTEPDLRTSAPASSSVNGFDRFANGQLVEVSSPSASSSNRYAAAQTSRTYLSPSTAGPSSAPPTAAPTPVPAPAPAPVPPPPYHPGIPPPTNRPYFQPYSGPATSSTSSNLQYHSPRGGPQVIARTPAPPTTPSMAPNYYMMGRYPQSHPPYYPPYQ